eukprot:CAMPEP_0174247220 /NCGR_PEP_ID=MMETSP0417-20130205/42465_1 /TAXON_ID=242541 /ORGANISM="Mayorella sp, Strain BSH-02190019" /LENGTH=431 /DNA_ID=CAMNT_0015327077 /DNA_START=78 /DNA_END=1373 /DNA_ORIENTATION=+
MSISSQTQPVLATSSQGLYRKEDEPVLPKFSGYLLKQGVKGLSRSWKKRWFVADPELNNMRYFRKPPTSERASDIDSQALGVIELDALTDLRIREASAYTFDLVTPGRTYNMQAETEKSFQRWTSDLMAVFVRNQKRREALAANSADPRLLNDSQRIALIQEQQLTIARLQRRVACLERLVQVHAELSSLLDDQLQASLPSNPSPYAVDHSRGERSSSSSSSILSSSSSSSSSSSAGSSAIASSSASSSSSPPPSSSSSSTSAFNDSPAESTDTSSQTWSRASAQLSTSKSSLPSVATANTSLGGGLSPPSPSLNPSLDPSGTSRSLSLSGSAGSTIATPPGMTVDSSDSSVRPESPRTSSEATEDETGAPKSSGVDTPIRQNLSKRQSVKNLITKYEVISKKTDKGKVVKHNSPFKRLRRKDKRPQSNLN